MLNVLPLCSGIAIPATQVALQPTVNWRRIAGQQVRIIYDNEDFRPHLRAALAHDCDVDLLDAGQTDYAWVSYDKSLHRRLKRRHGMEVLVPVLHHMHWTWAYLMLKGYRAH